MQKTKDKVSKYHKNAHGKVKGNWTSYTKHTHIWMYTYVCVCVEMKWRY